MTYTLWSRDTPGVSVALQDQAWESRSVLLSGPADDRNVCARRMRSRALRCIVGNHVWRKTEKTETR